MADRTGNLLYDPPAHPLIQAQFWDTGVFFSLHVKLRIEEMEGAGVSAPENVGITVSNPRRPMPMDLL
ncbi:MAG: hypothetical protein GF383_00925 [Candidatus Lokiarchaeota archaeon]|nr:hypothetical protein [Candidatus Lokiarchaeota archaeon]